ncbi:hypothetical protein [Nitrogeniibacter aestuarii]|uniref:hypothetical protein n=1 Tax=Nitrogeniibacter aestuarii TaxID=2815343 RepID=UPI001D120B46|nr:hypothetical protein [Nitrogeniibacter aestuarii]
MLAGRAICTLWLNGVVIGAVCSMPAHAADGTALGVVRLAPQQERAAPPPPKRPYAINGESFYYEGTKIIIEGLVLPRPDSELAKQRLQRRLDSGEITYAPIGEPNGGVVRARVSIDGQALNN